MRRLWTIHKGGQSRPPLHNPANRPPVGADVPGGPRTAAPVGPHTGIPPCHCEGARRPRQSVPLGQNGGPLADDAVVPRTGLRLRFQPGVDPEVRAACIRFAAWLRRTYVFPVRVPVYVKAAATVTCRDGEEASAVFFGPDDPAQEPHIRLPAGDYPTLRQRWGRDGALGAILHSLAHELSHYFQWLNHHDAWLSDDPETDRRLERQAVYYADAILDDYAETVDHP